VHICHYYHKIKVKVARHPTNSDQLHLPVQSVSFTSKVVILIPFWGNFMW